MTSLLYQWKIQVNIKRIILISPLLKNLTIKSNNPNVDAVDIKILKIL